MAVAVAEISVIQSDLHDYRQSWAFQRELHEKVASGQANNTLILVEHDSVFTAGRRTEAFERPTDGTPVIDVDRGGRITWHGPGQIVGYPIVRLAKRNELVGFVRIIEGALIETLANFGISGVQIPGKTGVWIRDEQGERKIAAIGIRVAKGVSMHGFALNVCPDLANFDRIVACGMPEAVTTSMERELGRAIAIPEVLRTLQPIMLEALGRISI